MLSGCFGRSSSSKRKSPTKERIAGVGPGDPALDGSAGPSARAFGARDPMEVDVLPQAQPQYMPPQALSQAQPPPLPPQPASSQQRPYEFQRADSYSQVPRPMPQRTASNSSFVRAPISPGTEIFVWGMNDSGQLGFASSDLQESPQPRLLPTVRDTGLSIIDAAAGSVHTVLLTASGEVHGFGSNENGQLGAEAAGEEANARREVPTPLHVHALESQRVLQVACGETHTAVLLDTGVVATWGAGEIGQLGIEGAAATRNPPRMVKSLKGKFVVRVACGSYHTLFLTATGEVYGCGQNSYGQIGTGAKDANPVFVPALAKGLWGKPVTGIAAGEAHSVCVTAGGVVHAWGRNRSGQLGLGDQADRTVPTPVRDRVLAGERATHVDCGGDHSIVVCQSGRVFCFGCSMGGRIRQNSPRLMGELEGRTRGRPVAGAAASAHTYAVLTDQREVYAFTCEIPVQIRQLHELSGRGASALASGAAHTVCVCASPAEPAPPAAAAAGLAGPPSRAGSHSSVALQPPWARLVGLPVLDAASLGALLQEAAARRSPAGLLRAMHQTLPVPALVNGSFLRCKPNGAAEPMWGGLDLAAVSDFYVAVIRLDSAEAIRALESDLDRLLAALEPNARGMDDPETLRALLFLLHNPMLLETARNAQILRRLFETIEGLPKPAQSHLINWWATYPQEAFSRLLKVCHSFLNLAYRAGVSYNHLDPAIVYCCKVMQLLHMANEKGRVVPYARFYNDLISRKFNLREDYPRWRSRQYAFAFCHYPFLLDVATKSEVLHAEASLQMESEIQYSLIDALRRHQPVFMPFLVLEVRRPYLIHDALNGLLSLSPRDLKKPLKVAFAGEEAVDAGGVRKEFFQLVVQVIFDAQYGMFVEHPESRHVWFNAHSFENDSEFMLVGILLGLAIYNAVILDLHFPLVVYKKLMRIAPSLEDLKEVNPAVGSSMQQLLEYTGDVENDLCLTFAVQEDYFGEVRQHELKPGGASIPVTDKNREEYVELFVKHRLVTSIARQFEAFAKGFLLVCETPAMMLFRAEELEALICGSAELDFRELEKACRYDGGYTPETPVVRWFWEFVHAMSTEEKKALLMFATGSDRSPIRGLGSLPFVVQRQGPDTERLPTAHTCFNVLMLPEYRTRERLREKLLTAICNCTGFGLK
eukprot:tig00020616_g12269.t1